MSSTVTLPSEESQAASSSSKKRFSLGFRILRNVLRALKRNHTDQPIPSLSPPLSSVGTSTDSSTDHQLRHQYNHPHIATQQRPAKTSTEPEPTKPVREHPTKTSLKHKFSPRRPSLASIFRLGQKNKAVSTTVSSPMDNIQSTTGQSSCQDSSSMGTTEEEESNRMELASDPDHDATMDVGIDGKSATRSPRPHDDPTGQFSVLARNPSASKSPIAREASFLLSSPTRLTRLSNVEEMDVDRSSAEGKSRSCAQPHGHPHTTPSLPPLRIPKGGASHFVWSAPQQSFLASVPSGSTTANDKMGSRLLPDAKLAMTPANIRPLLENAKEVLARLQSCNAEIQLLLAT
jgi:hypothetical protein